MTAALVDIAAAVKTELEDINLSQAFDLFRSYGDWEDLLDDFSGGKARIDVVGADCPPKLFDRSTHEYKCFVSILLRKRILREEQQHGKIDVAVVDQQIADLQTIHEFFAPSQPNYSGRKLTDVPTANWQMESTIKAPYSRKMLREHGQYSGWVSVVYSVYKSL